jgi:transposase-like protein
MALKLHANATTTPRIRAYIQKSQASNAALARELGIHSRTVARWKGRQDGGDRSTRPHRLATTMTEWEDALIVELRRSLALPLDDIVEAMRRCINAYSDDVGRAFRLMSATCSDRSRPAVPIDVGRGGGAPAGRM